MRTYREIRHSLYDYLINKGIILTSSDKIVIKGLFEEYRKQSPTELKKEIAILSEKVKELSGRKRQLNICITKHAIDKISGYFNIGNAHDARLIASIAIESNQKLPKWFTDGDKDLRKTGFATYSYYFCFKCLWVFNNEDGVPKLITVYKNNKNEHISSI